VGPRDVLNDHEIPIRVELPGVGSNLQDRYEVGVVNRMRDDWALYKGVKFDTTDDQYQRWSKKRDGIYATNGAVLTMFNRSRHAGELPDLFCMALLAQFKGYFPGYSALFPQGLNYLTWVILKAHTRNRKGRVTLRSNDPRDTPRINFNYFEEGGDEDLEAVVEGIQFVRQLTAKLANEDLIVTEEIPGKDCQSVDDLKNGTGSSNEFPGGYAKVAPHMKPGHTWYRFKFVKSGERLGMAYDGFTFVNHHWVIVPKPWRALKE